MLKTLVDGLKTKTDLENHEKEWGGFNDPLPNMVEISMKEFAQSEFFTYGFTSVEFRQINPGLFDKSKLLSPIITYEGYKVFYGTYTRSDGIVMMRDFWEGKVRIFKFAKCYHDYVDLSAKEAHELGHTHFGNCYHVMKCKECGKIYAYDSSD